MSQFWLVLSNLYNVNNLDVFGYILYILLKYGVNVKYSNF